VTPSGHTATTNTVFAIKVIGGLVALLVLADLGGHRRVHHIIEQARGGQHELSNLCLLCGGHAALHAAC